MAEAVCAAAEEDTIIDRNKKALAIYSASDYNEIQDIGVSFEVIHKILCDFLGVCFAGKWRAGGRTGGLYPHTAIVYVMCTR